MEASERRKGENAQVLKDQPHRRRDESGAEVKGEVQERVGIWRLELEAVCECGRSIESPLTSRSWSKKGSVTRKKNIETKEEGLQQI